MKTTKTLCIATAALLFTMAFAAVATADDEKDEDKNVQNAGNLSRTFLYQGDIQWKVPEADDDKKNFTDPPRNVGGAGWYDPNDRGNLCFLRVLGGNIGSGFYYDTLRITVNSPNIKVVEVGKTLIRVGCPFATADDGWIGHSGFNLYVSTSVAQSHLGCLDKPFGVDCNHIADTAKWHLHVCKANKSDMTFTPGNLFGLSDTGSSSIDCGGATAKNPEEDVQSYNVTDYLRFDVAENQTSAKVHMDQVFGVKKEKPEESTYVISCFYIDYTVFPPKDLLNPFEIFTSKSHDWFLKLGADATQWDDAIVNHLTGSPDPADLAPHPLKGLYDLSGDNECPVNPDKVDPDNNLTKAMKKDKKDPLVFIPGLGNLDIDQDATEIVDKITDALTECLDEGDPLDCVETILPWFDEECRTNPVACIEGIIQHLEEKIEG